jgi:hypothetical protein
VDFDSVLRGPKDAAIALAAKNLFNARYSRIGRMSDMSVDTAKREVRVRLELAGESVPIDIHVTDYRVELQSDAATVTIVDATASREWMTETLRQLVLGRPFVLSERAAALVKLLL